jgi:fermentation-respiration switch protein FrsA (DUF1100 family)
VVSSVTLLLAVCLLHGCNSWFYYPNQEIYGSAASYGLDAQDVAFAAPGGPRLHGWWTPARGEVQGTVVYCHGNYGNLTHHAGIVRWFPDRGFNLLIFDYRGFGRSEGSVDRAGTVLDAIAAIDFALARDPHRTVVFGHSLGGAIGLVAAASRPAVRAIAVESTFYSYRAAARCAVPALGFMVPLLVSDGFDPVDALPQIPPRPLLVIHGTDDEITPFQLGRELFDRAEDPKTLRVVKGGGHVTPWVAEREKFEAYLCGFFRASIRRGGVSSTGR